MNRQEALPAKEDLQTFKQCWVWVGRSWQNVHTSSSNLTSLPLHIHAINCELEFLCGRIIQIKQQEEKDNCFCRYGIGQDLLVPNSVYLIKKKNLQESLSIVESYFTQKFCCSYSGHILSATMPFIFAIVKMEEFCLYQLQIVKL